MLRYLPVVLALAAATLPAAADEFTDTVESALSAYRDGDVEGARQDLEYATKLLTAMKAESLAEFLPPALAGWTREDAGDAAEAGGMMAMLGGGTTTAATYRKGDAEMTITLVAGSPMVSGMAAMIGGLASMGGGKPIRIQRTEFGVNEGELQGVVGGKVLVSVSGNASIEDKTAHLEAMDFKALADF
jgi:hypothetical protein